MRAYRYRMPWGEDLVICADLVRAERGIFYLAGEECDDDPHWVPTPYQTADARHREPELLELVVRYLGAEWYAAPPALDDPPERIEVEHERALAAALAGAKLLAVTPCRSIGRDAP